LALANNPWSFAGWGKKHELFRRTAISLQAYANVVKPQQGGADWQLRFQVQFLFPK
jgi:hypothetical protein